jgi:hypothetical protein
VKEVSPASLFKDSTKASLELEKVFWEEVVFLLYFSDSFSIFDQFGIDVLIIRYLLNLMLFGNYLMFDGFCVEEFCLDGIGTPCV